MRTLLALVLLVPFACDSSAAKKDTKADSKANAETKTDAKAKEAKKAPAPDPKAQMMAKIEQLAVIPETLPKDVAAACEQLTTQLDLINQAKLTGDDLTKWKTGGKEGVLGPAKAMCLKRGNIAEAACAAEAMKKGGVEVEPHIGDIMQACGKKAGEGKAAPAAPPPK